MEIEKEIRHLKFNVDEINGMELEDRFEEIQDTFSTLKTGLESANIHIDLLKTQITVLTDEIEKIKGE